MTRVSSSAAQQVIVRADYHCEYCRTPRAITAQSFHIDHILPASRGGEAIPENLCYACPRCNLQKGDPIEAVDPRTRRRVRLFNPRIDSWADHFRWSATYRRILGRTAIGRATIAALDLNDGALMKARQMWVLLDLIP
ncbi:MAG: HNH endonuclease [Chloroflexi bacterium]|nr:HNH endonuclease [Chloroflexota bacterium]